MKNILVTVAAVFFASAAMATGDVGRSFFTTGIDEREPVDRIETLAPSEERVFFFTEVIDMSDRSITHRWSYLGQTMAEVGFDIGGDRWRVWSSKLLVPEWAGAWQVDVIDENGQVLDTKYFRYGEDQAEY
jgi:hypothetical protein